VSGETAVSSGHQLAWPNAEDAHEHSPADLPGDRSGHDVIVAVAFLSLRTAIVGPGKGAELVDRPRVVEDEFACPQGRLELVDQDRPRRRARQPAKSAVPRPEDRVGRSALVEFSELQQRNVGTARPS
jgi:hypothetical protein